MDVTAIIETARLNFGEKEALTLTDDDFVAWTNKALQEIFVLLPIEEIRPLIKTSSIAFADGKADTPTEWDKVLAVTKDNTDLGQVLPSTIQAMREMGPYFLPGIGVWSQIGSSLYVAPEVDGNLDVTFTEGPDEVDINAEVTEIPSHYIPALVNLVTSYAYAQEEDVQQAQEYYSKAMAMVMARRPGDEG